MISTCTITATAKDRNRKLGEKRWTGVDIMKTGHTKGWCTRMLNENRHDGVCVDWLCVHDQPAEGEEHRLRFQGHIVRVQGALLKRGICEFW